MNIYCRACGKVIARDPVVMTVKAFKRQYGNSCPHCRAPFSDWFKVKQEDKEA